MRRTFVLVLTGLLVGVVLNDGAGPSGDFITTTVGNHSHSVNIPSTTSTQADTGLPYIQLIMCEKD